MRSLPSQNAPSNPLSQPPSSAPAVQHHQTAVAQTSRPEAKVEKLEKESPCSNFAGLGHVAEQDIFAAMRRAAQRFERRRASGLFSQVGYLFTCFLKLTMSFLYQHLLHSTKLSLVMFLGAEWNCLLSRRIDERHSSRAESLKSGNCD